jgi:hypothetical protein
MEDLPPAASPLYGAGAMLASHLSSTFVRTSCAVALALLVSLAAFACDETPRGEQGIDFLDDGGLYTVPSNDARADDARGPCAENGDAEACAAATSEGNAAPHLIVCAPGNVPIDLVCVTPDASAPPDASFCCTTGLL